MTQKRMRGMGVAIITPFTETNEVDYAALERLVDLHLNSGTDFLCVQGTTGETPTLSIEEKRNIRKRVIEQVNGRMGIMLGCGGNNTQAVINELQTEDFTGVDGILCVVPYYNKPNQEGMYRHFKAIADSTTLPIYLYNVPGRCGVNMQPETTIRLANECSNIIGFKAASGNIEQIKKLIAMKPDTLDVLSGDDGLTYEIMKAGGVGVISVFGNVYPKECVELVRLLEQKRYDEAKELSDRYSEMFRLLFADGNPGGAKAQLSNMGYVKNILRLPLVPVREDVCEALRIEGERLKK
ncbi:MAG: 4-hydroxy-tetrahydrodipicolinate synthase [Bacteroidaceae bacterium]|nr:4-hydroxy-tetrahydrodipicolinate synthase [Bacteroidaceae bacterium]MBQ5705769.1 4-hydroxy-tetrahydrodipicolinate synthase [Bacteroidaceae bacterium]MBQ5817180.1 4-hydroxy-tetrahydrodipicolinate synthase [Bacteroidaceae bacterium]